MRCSCIDGALTEKKEGQEVIRALSYCLMVLVIIISLLVINTLQLPPKAMAQAASDGAKILTDDVIQDLKSNDTKKAQVHLNILNQQLTSLGNTGSIQSSKILINDAANALKNNNSNGAIVHLELVKQL